MIFKCGHDALAGKDGVCVACYNDGLKSKPKKKMGRPRTKTEAERMAKKKQWFEDNKEHRREYLRNYARKRRTGTSEFHPCLVRNWDLYAMGHGRWTPNKNMAKVYTSENRANAAVRMMGYGEVLRVDNE